MEIRTTITVKCGRLVLDGKGSYIRGGISTSFEACIRCEELRKRKKKKKLRFADEVE